MQRVAKCCWLYKNKLHLDTWDWFLKQHNTLQMSKNTAISTSSQPERLAKHVKVQSTDFMKRVKILEKKKKKEERAAV